MNRRPLVRALLASAAIAAAIALAGCNMEGTTAVSGRHLQPISERLIAEIENKNMAKESPILLRIFKQESELEVWKEDKTGRFALLKTYPICRWSGELGPKIKQGDRQAPEGFYTVTPAQMNPNSSLYLSFNMGFPNAFDRAHGRTGAHLMVHGDCSSAGCYAMTDEQISDIYALARESFLGGQKSFQIQALPFRMTPLNMAKHRNSPHVAFWRMLKDGYDQFELTKQEPKVDVCERRYVFAAESSGKFSAADKCPVYTVPTDLVAAVREKQRRDDAQVAELISRGIPAAPVTTGTDGGMNPIFLAAVKSHGGPGAVIRTGSGTIPAHVNPPGESSERTTGSTMSLASGESKPASGPRSSVRVASAESTSSGGIGSLFGNLVGSKSEDQASASRNAPSRDASAPKSKAATSAKPAQTGGASTIRPKSEPRPTESKTTSVVAAKPQSSPPKEEANAEPPQSKPDRTTSLLNGAAPTMPSGGFDNRFGAWR